MKPHTLNWLSCSILLVVSISCKKKAAGLFDDFPPGKFDFVWTTNHNGINDTLTGEVSGPYPIGTGFYFKKKAILGDEALSFRFSARTNGVTIDEIEIYQTSMGGKIINSRVDELNLHIDFNKSDTLIGTFNLYRK